MQLQVGVKVLRENDQRKFLLLRRSEEKEGGQRRGSKKGRRGSGLAFWRFLSQLRTTSIFFAAGGALAILISKRFACLDKVLVSRLRILDGLVA